MNTVATLLVADIIKEASLNYITNYQNAINSYRRLTFIQDNLCDICDNSSTSTLAQYTDNRIGEQGLYGWIYCSNCKKYMELAYINKELSVNHLFKKSYNVDQLSNISFWRKSRSNLSLPPYLVTNCHIDSTLQDGIFEYKERVCINLKWDTTRANEIDKTLVKSVPLSNVIYFNNTINWKDTWKSMLQQSKCYTNKKWVDKWNKLFEKEYDIVCKWIYIKKAIYIFNYNFPMNLIINIMDYWGELYS